MTEAEYDFSMSAFMTDILRNTYDAVFVLVVFFIEHSLFISEFVFGCLYFAINEVVIVTFLKFKCKRRILSDL